MKPWVVPAVVSFLLGCVGSATMGAIVGYSAIARFEVMFSAYGTRISNLENGATTLISAEARAALSDLRTKFDRLSDRLDRFMERDAKRRREEESNALFPMLPRGG